jgi:2-amino-4-hydroxy-6-hydroxymethyldihydropteridine diphosphokinase
MSRAYLGIGSNLGDRLGHLQLALDALGADSRIEVTAVSPVYETDPVGGPVQDDFLNAVVQVETSLDPHGLLRVAQAAEQSAHRVRTEHWGPRTLDVDILRFDEVVLDDPDLVIPHPMMSQRAFVLAPLHDLDPALAPTPDAGWVGVRRTDDVLQIPGPRP